MPYATQFRYIFSNMSDISFLLNFKLLIANIIIITNSTITFFIPEYFHKINLCPPHSQSAVLSQSLPADLPARAKSEIHICKGPLRFFPLNLFFKFYNVFYRNFNQIWWLQKWESERVSGTQNKHIDLKLAAIFNTNRVIAKWTNIVLKSN